MDGEGGERAYGEWSEGVEAVVLEGDGYISSGGVGGVESDSSVGGGGGSRGCKSKRGGGGERGKMGGEGGRGGGRGKTGERMSAVEKFIRKYAGDYLSDTEILGLFLTGQVPKEVSECLLSFPLLDETSLVLIWRAALQSISFTNNQPGGPAPPPTLHYLY